MTTEQKCNKLAQILENVAKKLRTREGHIVWNSAPYIITSLAAQAATLSVLITKVTTQTNTPQKKQTLKTSKNPKDEDEWPDILT